MLYVAGLNNIMLAAISGVFLATVVILLFALKRRESFFVVREAQLKAIFATSPTPLLVGFWQEGDYATSQVNQAWINKFQLRPEQVTGFKAGEFSWWVSLADRARFIQQSHEGFSVKEFHVWLRRANGEVFLGSVSSQTQWVAGRQMLVIAYDDISSTYTMQMHLQELNRELEARVMRRTQALQEANAKLEQTLQSLEIAQQDLIQSEKLAALGSLVAGVAHELSTPLGNALMAASTLNQEIVILKDELNKGLRRSSLDVFLEGGQLSASIMQRNLKRAVELINSFRQVAVDRASEQVREFNLHQVLLETLTLFQPVLRNSSCKVTLEVSSDLNLFSYPGALSQVITNLIQNALLHAFEGKEGACLIDIKAHLNAPLQIELSVTDNGKGMDSDLCARVFDPFFTTKFGQGGTGLGLHLAHNLVTGVLGGRIELNSELGSGSCFTLQFPSHVESSQ